MIVESRLAGYKTLQSINQSASSLEGLGEERDFLQATMIVKTYTSDQPNTILKTHPHRTWLLN